MNKGVKDAIESITTEFEENPLSFLNEQDIVCRLIEILKDIFPDKVRITSQAIKGHRSSTSRVHAEVDIPIHDNQKGRRPKIDIAVFENKDVELKGWRWEHHIPSCEVDLNDILFGIEVKFYGGSKEQYTKAEIENLKDTAEKLNKLGEDKSTLLVFIHGYIRGNAKEILDTKFKGLNKEIITSGMWEKEQ